MYFIIIFKVKNVYSMIKRYQRDIMFFFNQSHLFKHGDDELIFKSNSLLYFKRVFKLSGNF